MAKQLFLASSLVLMLLLSGCFAPGQPPVSPNVSIENVTPENVTAENATVGNVTPALQPKLIASVVIQSINIIKDTAGVPSAVSFAVQATAHGEPNETVNYACKAAYLGDLVDPGISLRKQIPAGGERTDSLTLSASVRGKSPEEARWGVCCDLIPLNVFSEKTTTTVCSNGG